MSDVGGPKARQPRLAPDERSRRLEQAEQAVLACLDDRQAVRALCEALGVGRRQAWRYVAAVRCRWRDEARRENSDEARATRRYELRATLQALYRDARNAGDFRTAERVLGRLCDLDGLAASPSLPFLSQPVALERESVKVAIVVRDPRQETMRNAPEGVAVAIAEDNALRAEGRRGST